MRTLIVGDVHGCKDELEELVERFGFVPGRDRLLQTGDMISRGPDSLGALELARDLSMRSVMGNHEARLLRILAERPMDRVWKDKVFLERLGDDAVQIAAMVREWPLWIEDEQFFLVHAGFQPGVSHPVFMDARVLLHVRTWDGKGVDMDNEDNPPWFLCDAWSKTIVFGHWANVGLVQRPGLRGLDTGCAVGGALTGWCPEENRIYQVKSNQGNTVQCLQQASA